MKKREYLENAIHIAVNAHAGQTDRAGKPYILHVFRVMLAGETADEMIVGVLHDTVEDTPITIPTLKGLFPKEIVDAVDAITKRPGEKYKDYLLRVHSNPLATKVKLNDLKDNMDVTRLKKIGPKDKERGRKYLDAYQFLKYF